MQANNEEHTVVNRCEVEEAITADIFSVVTEPVTVQAGTKKHLEGVELMTSNNEYINLLERALGSVLTAQASGNEARKRTVLGMVMSSPDIPQQVKMRARTVTVQHIPLPCETLVTFLSQDELSLNIYGYAVALYEELLKQIDSTIAFAAIGTLYSGACALTPQAVIYARDAEQLTVYDLLKVSGYSMDFAELVCNTDTMGYKEGVLALKGINFALSNRPSPFIGLKTMGYAVEVVSAAAKYFVKDESARKDITLTSTLFNLAIDFFTKAR